MKMNRNSWRVPVALMVVAALGGCGVKSTPGTPDGSTYPRVYPAVGEPTRTAPAARPAPAGTETDTRRRDPSSGFYTPPPAATEIQSK